MAKIVFIANESPWPSNHGGRIRMANVIRILANYHEVSLIFPSSELIDIPEYINQTLRLPKTNKIPHKYSTRPILGRKLLEPYLSQIAEFIESQNPDWIYWSHSYLPAAIPELSEKYSGRNVVEFANIEGQRFLSMAKQAKFKPKIKLLIESMKAQLWEPRIANRSQFAVALSSQDYEFLTDKGAKVILAANGLDYQLIPESNSNHLLIFASMNYTPNLQATQDFVENFWPKISETFPDLKLLIAGRSASYFAALQSDRIEVASDPISQDEIYERALVTIIPTSSGGGSQLKITESMQRGRLCLLSRYSLATAPAELKEYLSEFVYDSPDDFLRLLPQILNQATRAELVTNLENQLGNMNWEQTLAGLLAELAVSPVQNI